MGELENCASRIKNWMDGNRLKVNDSKTEFIMFGSRMMLTKCITTDININSTSVKRENIIRYLGAWLFSVLPFKHHVKTKCKSAMFNLFEVVDFLWNRTVDSLKTSFHLLL